MGHYSGKEIVLNESLIPPKQNFSITASQIEEAIEMYAGALVANYKPSDFPGGIVFLCVLDGAVPFFKDFVEAYERRWRGYCRDWRYSQLIRTQFIRIKSYVGEKRVEKPPHVDDLIDCNLADCRVVVVDDILDSGKTLQCLTNYLQKYHNPKAIVSISLLGRAGTTIPENHYGLFEVPEKCYVYGYGMDYRGHYRNLPYVEGFPV